MLYFYRNPTFILTSFVMRCLGYLVFATLLTGLLASCQTKKTEVASGISAQDSIRVFQLFEQAYTVQNTDPDSAFALIVEAGNISRRVGFDNGLFNYYNQAIYNRAAYRGQFDVALQMADTALNLVEVPNRKRFRLLMNFTKAITYQLQEQHDSAIVYYLKALDNQPFTRDSSRVPIIQNNLAILFHFQQRDDLAVKYQRQALQEAEAKKDTGRMIGGYVNLYGFEVARRDTATAFTYLDKGLALAQTPAVWRQEAELFKNAGEYYLAQRQPDRARLYFKKYYDLTQTLYPHTYLALPLIGLAQTDWLAGDGVATERHLNEAARLTAIDSLPMLERQNFYNIQYQLFRKTARPVLALTALEKYNAAVAEFEQGEKNRQLVNYHEQVQQLTHEKELAERQYAIDRKNSWIIGLSAGFIGLAILATVLVLYWRKRKMLESEKLAKLHLETEWNALKSRIAAQQEERGRISQELHDELGAALTSISLASELLLQNGPPHATEVQIIARASSEMTTRMNEIVWSLNVNNDNLQSLVAYIRKFCADFLGEAGIQMIFSENIVDPERELKGTIRRNVYQSVKEAVHNVVKHAEASQVELAIATVENELHILIRDNGKGMGIESAKSWSNGLRNMRKNIEAIKGRIDWITENGTQVRIQAPLLSE